MKKKQLSLLFILLFIFIAVTGLARYFSSSGDDTQFLLLMDGKGSNWEVNDYQLAWSDKKGEGAAGNASVSYLGNTEELEGYVSVDIYDSMGNVEQPRSGTSFLAESLTDGPETLGGGNFYSNKGLTLAEIAEQTYAVIQWSTIDGQVHEETIQMDLNFEPYILDILNEN